LITGLGVDLRTILSRQFHPCSLNMEERSFRTRNPAQMIAAWIICVWLPRFSSSNSVAGTVRTMRYRFPQDFHPRTSTTFSTPCVLRIPLQTQISPCWTEVGAFGDSCWNLDFIYSNRHSVRRSFRTPRLGLRLYVEAFWPRFWARLFRDLPPNLLNWVVREAPGLFVYVAVNHFGGIAALLE
jgi:hypothetical protein